jgi:predicted ATP-dependent endonuclease of OLD family
VKKLKKILLINWLYFSKELIEVNDINFLTGKNAAGKSTIIDALQIVLVGETNARNFNQAANEKSQRTFDELGEEYNYNNLIDCLFYCAYIDMGYIDPLKTEGAE